MQLLMKVIMLVTLLWHAFLLSESSDVVHIERQEGKVNGNNRQKREETCEEKYSTITTGHSACLRTNKAQVSGVTDTEKTEIVNLHNSERRTVNPTATNMMMMSWDNEIANTAQRWAENCDLVHDGNYKRYAFGRFSVGQNLGIGQSSWEQVIQQWANEKSLFTYGRKPSPGVVVGHYTQMVWAETSKIGCGYAKCDSNDFYVCNYGPAGNLLNNYEPYKSGDTCDDCSSKCINNLCDCQGRVCMNGGDMDLSTCTCSCKKDLSFFLKPDCGLNCTDVKEASYCNQWKDLCETVSNVPQECPLTCKWCPSAAYASPGNVTTEATKGTTEVPEVKTEVTEVTTEAPNETSAANLLLPMPFQIFILIIFYI